MSQFVGHRSLRQATKEAYSSEKSQSHVRFPDVEAGRFESLDLDTQGISMDFILWHKDDCDVS